jgi:hypothetical protein
VLRAEEHPVDLGQLYGAPKLGGEPTVLLKKIENEPPESIDHPIVRKKFRFTIDVEATLASGSQGGVLSPSPEDVPHTKALMERLLAQPELVDRLLPCRAVERSQGELAGRWRLSTGGAEPLFPTM